MKNIVKVKKLFKNLVFIGLVFFTFLGCRKNDVLNDDKSENYEALQKQFFNTAAVNDAEIKKLAENIKKQDSIFKFLPEFARKNGIPKWNKVIYKTKYVTAESGRQATFSSKSNNQSTLDSSQNSNNQNQGVFFIPLQSQNSSTVQSYITAYKHNDSLYTYRVYNKDSLNALQPGSNTTKNNLLNTQAVFGYFEKSINNIDSLNVNSPVNATIKNVSINFGDASGTNSNNQTNNNSITNTDGCSFSITVSVSYTIAMIFDEDWNLIAYGISVSVTMIIQMDCSGGGGGGGYSGGYSGGNPPPNGGSNSSGSGNWWNSGSGGYWGGGSTFDPNWWWWWTGGGGIGGGGNNSGFSSTVTSLSLQLGLTYGQSLWLEQNPIRANELQNYLQTSTNPEAMIISIKHLDKIMVDLDYLNFVQTHYISTGNQMVWWEDDNWFDNPNNFNLDLDKDENNQYDKLTLAEKILVRQYPLEAYKISKNKDVAELETVSLFGVNGLNDKSDAFRHAFFNAMNMRDCGRDQISFQRIAKLFSDAHETETPPQLQKEKDMDLWNNEIGHIVGDVFFSWFTSNASLSSEISMKLINGDLRYLKPIEARPAPGGNGINNDFWHINGNSQLGKHGITNATQLTPTNQ